LQNVQVDLGESSEEDEANAEKEAKEQEDRANAEKEAKEQEDLANAEKNAQELQDLVNKVKDAKSEAVDGALTVQEADRRVRLVGGLEHEACQAVKEAKKSGNFNDVRAAEDYLEVRLFVFQSRI
jgi:hypothetical protein